MKSMLRKVPSVNYEKCYPSRLKRFFKRDYNYRTYDSFVPNAKNKLLGNLPNEIINLFDKSERGTKIKEFQKGLANTTKYIRGLYKQCKENNIIQYGFEDLDPQDLKLIEKDISNLMNKTLKGVVPKDVKAKLSYIGKGCWGNTFKLSMTDKNGKIMHDKALKVFHHISCPVPSLKRNQGSYAEANVWTFLKNAIGHKMDKTQFTRHYISDVENGYSLTEFADKNILPTTAPVDFENLFKIFYTDVTNEKINGKLYDIGGCIKFPNFINDKVTLRYFKKLMHRNPEKDLQPFLENLQEKIKNPKTPDREKIQRAIEIFNKSQNSQIF